MATLASKLRKKQPQRKTSAPPKPNEEKKQRKPAYLQRKMAVSQPHDPEEQEADQVAKEVSRAKKTGEQPGVKEDKEMISSKPVPSAQRLLRRLNRAAANAVKPEEPQKSVRRAKKPDQEKNNPVAQRSVETEDREKPVQAPGQKALQRKTEAAKPEDEKKAARLFRKTEAAKPEEEQTLQKKLMRAAAQSEQQAEQDQQATASAAETNDVEPSIEERIEQTRGRGTPLPDAVLRDMEKQFGQDLSRVVIHNDAHATALCKELNARAFTVGNDIYFAPGEYAPETDQGRELLAHEMTHVVQQSGGIKQKVARKAPAGGSAAGSSDPVFEVSEPLEIPPIKSRHALRYQGMARAGQLQRPKGSVSENRDTKQREQWKGVKPNLNKIPADRRPNAAHGFKLNLNMAGKKKEIKADDEETFLDLLRIPTWDGSGKDTSYQVDHIVEHQLGGEDALHNMELLNASHNGSVGSSFRGEIRDAVERTIAKLKPTDPRLKDLGTPGTKPSAQQVLDNRVTKFKAVAAVGGHQRRREEGGSTFWSQDDIKNLAPVLDLLDDSAKERKGTTTRFSILSPTGGLAITKISHAAKDVAFKVPAAQKKALSGFNMTNVTLVQGYNKLGANAKVGDLSVELDLGPQIKVTGNPGALDIPLYKEEDVDFAGKISSESLETLLPKKVDLKGASPVDLSGFSINRGLAATAMLQPTHPLLQGLQVPGQIVNGRLGIFHTFDANSLAKRLPIPGLTVNDATITLGYDGERLSVSGDMQFAVRNFGDGSLAAELDSEGNFGLAGRFRADSRLFDQAELQMAYRSTTGFGISGTLAITSPDKIKGIRSAAITASYNAGNFSATGTVEPNIPGIQQAGLTVAYSEADGLTIGGNLQLSANPAIRSGSIDVTVNKRSDDWKVRATGSAQPAIPGIDSQLTVSYDDGAFTAEFSGAFKRGMLAGTVTVGASNRAVGEDGRPSGDPMPDGALTVFGSGSATIQIASWLQGTAGIRFDPNGEVTVSGEIGIPSNVEIFARKEIDKSLFSIGIDIPIVPGITAEIGGGLNATAGIGPGVIDQLSLGITYNPAHEEDTHVTGNAHLRVPADAGLRLSVRAGIGLGIPGVSVTGGLEIGGTLGIQGAAEAGVAIDWTPAQGLDLTANLSVHAQPAFTFDISGYVRAKALFWEVYSNRWTFASYTFGSNYRFGISLPIHYHEGQPFDISLDDVQFEVPDISPSDILSGLIERIA